MNIKYVFDVWFCFEDNIFDVWKYIEFLYYKFKNSGYVVEVYYKGKYDFVWKYFDGGLFVRN